MPSAPQPRTGDPTCLILCLERLLTCIPIFFPPSLIALSRTGHGPGGLRVENRAGAEFVIHKGLTYELPELLYRMNRRIEQMDRDGIDISVLALVSNLFLYELDPQEIIDLCRVANDDVAQMCSAAPDRLFGMATLPLNDPQAAVAELQRAHTDLGLVAVCMGTSVGDVMLDDPSLDPVYALAEECSMPLMLHPYIYMMVDPPRGAEGFHLPNVIGNPLETVVAGFRLIVGGTLDRHPGLEVQLSHGGGNFPYQLGRLQHAYEERGDTSAIALKPPTEYLDQFLFDTVIFDLDTLEFLIAKAGISRVVFGTDIPFDMADTLPLRIVQDGDVGWGAEVLGGNAMRSYNLATASGRSAV